MQLQTQQPDPHRENDCDDKTVNNVVPERFSRLKVESGPDNLKNAALYSCTRKEIYCFISKF